MFYYEIRNYEEENKAHLQAFLKMDDYDAHVKTIQVARDIYINEVKTVTSLFKNLKNFVSELTKDKTELDNLFKDAGQQLLADRGANNLEDNNKLLNTMIRFVQTHQVVLLKKDLPPQYVQQLKDKQISLTATNQAWLDEKAAGSAASSTKTNAGNELKNRLVDMFSDAQAIFIDEKNIAKKFVWNTLLASVRGARDAGISGKTVDKDTKKEVGNITLSILSLNLSVVSDALGRFSFPPMPAGTYDIDVKGEGFKPFVIEGRVVKENVMGRLMIEMESL